MFAKQDIEHYFLAEKNMGLFFLILGILAVVTACTFFFAGKTAWARGFVIPLAIIGILQSISGAHIFRKSDGNRKELVYAYDMNPEKLRTVEYPRMQKLMRSFVTIKWTEFALIGIAIFLFFWFSGARQNFFWRGFAVALFLQMAISLTGDIVSEKRASVYMTKLNAFINA